MLKLSPRTNTGVRLSVTFVLGMLAICLPKLAPHLPTYVGYVDGTLLLGLALSNVLHVPASAVSIINALVAALQGYINPPAPESDEAVNERAAACTRLIVSAKKLLGKTSSGEK